MLSTVKIYILSNNRRKKCQYDTWKMMSAGVVFLYMITVILDET